MSLREEVEITKIDTFPCGQIGVHKTETIYKGDELISSRDVVKLYNPGDTIEEPGDRVRNIARAIWTQDLINRYKTDSLDTESRN